MAASISPSAGLSRSSRRTPASVGTTLRVVRLSSLTPSCASSLRTASLRPDALMLLWRAPSRKPPARATDTKALRSPRLAFIVRIFARAVQIVPYFRAYWQGLPEADHNRLTKEIDHDQRSEVRRIYSRRPHGLSLGLRRHAARRSWCFRPAQGSRCGAQCPARGRRSRRQSHRHQRLLRAARHQPDHPRGAAPIPRTISPS